MGERISKRVDSFVALRCGGRIDMDVVTHEELFQHLAGSYKEITVTTLTPEFEGVVGGSLRTRCTIAGDALFEVGTNGNLKLPFDSFHEIDKFGRCTEMG
jgi:hypothetical protein